MKDDKVPVLGSHSTSTHDSEIISLDNESKDFNKFSWIDIDLHGVLYIFMNVHSSMKILTTFTDCQRFLWIGIYFN